jgi:hypothetical protein
MGDDSRMTAVQAAICDLVNMPAQVANTAGMTVQQVNVFLLMFIICTRACFAL